MTRSSSVRLRSFMSTAALVLGAALLAGCETTRPGPVAQTQPPPEPPMTRSQAAELCWMSTEKTNQGMNLDKRADLVTKCIEDKMKGGAAPKS